MLQLLLWLSALVSCSAALELQSGANTYWNDRRVGAPLHDDGRNYLNWTASSELLALRSAEIALQRSLDVTVRSAALVSLREHNGLSAQLAYAGRRLNILPKAYLLAEDQRMLLNLVNSLEFDRTYILQRRTACVRAYNYHHAYFISGRSSTLRAIAKRGREVATLECDRLRNVHI